MIKAWIASVVLVLLVGAALAERPIGSQTTIVPAPSAHHPGRIEEDDAGWDCKTMGNRQCGPPVRLQ
ncbi:hypothetical protein E1161_13460 [Saccharopolyspora aridisoli]|uniref:Uncharacterized protein n=1 Tax=Saccharopolyspora aridisoli TaxID=2530385 RepID=A0A4R4UQB0_9PSEU|nr:hypothetical protein E1161_13460 [Saccharopolyspora aridisoli]